MWRNTVKYIIFERSGLEVPVIFGHLITHRDMYAGNLKPISAGFVTIFANEKEWDTITCSNEIVVSCWGESESMKLQSRKEIDAEIIKLYIKRTLNMDD